MTLKAQVRQGRLVLAEPTDLPEGTEVELTPVFDDDLGPEERQALEASLERSAAQLARDELMDADEVLRRLRRGQLVKARAVRFTPEAAAQAEVAVSWWRQNRPGSGDLFANELRGTDLIARAPGTGLPEPGFARGAACGTPPVTFSGTAAQRGPQTKRTLERHVVTQAWEPTGEEYERPTQIGMALLPMTRNGSEG